MKEINKKNQFILTTCAIFCVLYFIFALRPLTTELKFSPQWTQNIFRISDQNSLTEASATQKKSVADGNSESTEQILSETALTEEIIPSGLELIPFKLGQNIGFFTEDGKIKNSITYPFKAAISSNYYSCYGFSNNAAEFFYPDGTKAGVINECGFPFFDEDRIFVFLPGGNSFVKCNEKGERLFSFESYAPITAFSSSSSGTIAGYSDGTVVSLTNEGRIDQQFAPGGSEQSVILGCDISEDGNRLAIVSGHNKQRFTVAEKTEGHTRIIFHEYIPSETNRQVLVRFNEEKDLVYYGYKNGLGIVNLKKLKSNHINIEGNIIQIEKSSVENMIFVLSRNGNTYTVTALESPANKAASFSFEANCAFIQVRGDKLFVGRDDKISLLNISRG